MAYKFERARIQALLQSRAGFGAVILSVFGSNDPKNRNQLGLSGMELQMFQNRSGASLALRVLGNRPNQLRLWPDVPY